MRSGGSATCDPGSSKTIRGSVRLKAAQPGQIRNLVYALAANSRLANDAALARVTGGPRACGAALAEASC